MWIQSLFKELQINSFKPFVLWIDNQSAISLANNYVLHARTKHIELDFHFVRKKVANQSIQVSFVPSIDQVANIITKPLSHQFFAQLRQKLGVISLTPLELRRMLEVMHDA